jgi:hypothetical protein
MNFYNDFLLWESYKQDFNRWTLATWALANGDIVKNFQDFL